MCGSAAADQNEFPGFVILRIHFASLDKEPRFSALVLVFVITVSYAPGYQYRKWSWFNHLGSPPADVTVITNTGTKEGISDHGFSLDIFGIGIGTNIIRTKKHKIAEKINTFLEPIRQKRASYEARPSVLKEALRAGNTRTLKISQETMRLVREAMHLSYHNLLGGTHFVAG